MMGDPLGHVESGPPCPSCGYRISLGALERVRKDLRRRKAELPKPPRKIPPIAPGSGISVTGNRTLNVGGSAGIVAIDCEICSRCGAFWKPNAAQEAEAALTEIRTLRAELESAVDLLGRVAREEEEEEDG